MLVLTRRMGQQIVIDDEITVTVVAIRGDKARLGISATIGPRGPLGNS
jgi:carbon storage regulator CsrA